MSAINLEHVNITVDDPDATAAMLNRIFGWTVRWRGQSGASIHGGFSLHVGEPDDGTGSSYLALYRHPEQRQGQVDSYRTRGGLNHVGVVVEDLDTLEARVVAEGLEPHSHADYEPGRRFYFHTPDGIEFEVVSYT
ncbi:MAG: VOC family protein [Paracoccaceae bacterium]|nr:VOC family protein [Paracoccaceae bacterium]